MAFSSGAFSLVAGNPVVTGTTISSTWANNTLEDIADNGLSICVLKDGTQTITANIPMSNFRFTGLGNGSAVADSVRLSQVQNNAFNILTGVSGVTTITGSSSVTPAAYAEGQVFRFVPVGSNGASPTLNVSSVGAAPIFMNGATATTSSLRSGVPVDVIYLAASVSTASQTGFHVLGHSGFVPASLISAKAEIFSGGATNEIKIVPAPASDGLVLASTASTSAGISWQNATLLIDAATVTTAGRVELATQAEVDAGTDTSRVLYPNHNRIALATEATASGTSVDFTGFPDGTRRITVMLVGVSLSGTDDILIQIGDSGGVENTDYLGASSEIGSGGNPVTSNFTSGFGVKAGTAAATIHGAVTITLQNSSNNTWVAGGVSARSDATSTITTAGSKALSGAFTQVRITRSGTDTFDGAGLISVAYER